MTKRWRRLAKKPWSPFLLIPVFYVVFWIWVPDVVAAIFAIIVALLLIIFRLIWVDVLVSTMEREPPHPVRTHRL